MSKRSLFSIVLPLTGLLLASCHFGTPSKKKKSSSQNEEQTSSITSSTSESGTSSTSEGTSSTSTTSTTSSTSSSSGTSSTSLTSSTPTTSKTSSTPMTSSTSVTPPHSSSSTSTAPVVIYPTSISLNPTSKELTVGESFAISATVYPTNASYKTVSFSSSSSAATVSSTGYVTAVAAGNPTITASIQGETSLITATCTLNITNGELEKTHLKYTVDDYFKYNAYENMDNCPTKGNVKILILPIWFTDSNNYIAIEKKASVRSDIETTYLGSQEDTGWHSVKSYYEEESLGQLSITGTVAEWYEPGVPMTNYKTDDDYLTNTVNLVKSATNAYFSNHTDDSRKNYDADGDGYLDGVFLIYAAPDYRTLNLSEHDNLWAYCYWTTSNASKTNPVPNAFFWASYDFMYDKNNAYSKTGGNYGGGSCRYMDLDAHTFIHEMGHVLGLSDYYDYGENGYTAAGGFSMQDWNVGGHDPYSTMLYGWTDPYIPTSTTTIEIRDFQSSHDVILLANHSVTNSPFDEYLLLELFTPTGLNQGDCTHEYQEGYYQGPTTPGIRLWHVDARLTQYNNMTGKWSTSLINNPSAGNVYFAMMNSYPPSEHYSFLGDDYADFNELQLIRNNTSESYHPTSFLSEDDLFKAGDSFSMTTFSNQFVGMNKMNNKSVLGWTFTVDSLSSSKATITVTKG